MYQKEVDNNAFIVSCENYSEIPWKKQKTKFSGSLICKVSFHL